MCDAGSPIRPVNGFGVDLLVANEAGRQSLFKTAAAMALDGNVDRFPRDFFVPVCRSSTASRRRASETAELRSGTGGT
jgi:hypothetical protein